MGQREPPEEMLDEKARFKIIKRLQKKVDAGGICLFGEKTSLIDFLCFFYPHGSEDRRVDLFCFQAEGKLGAVAFITPSPRLKAWLEVAVQMMKHTGREVEAASVDLIRFPEAGGMVLGTSLNFEDRWSGLNDAFREIWKMDVQEFFKEYIFPQGQDRPLGRS